MQFHHIGIVVKNLEYGKTEIIKFVDISSISDEVVDQKIGVKKGNFQHFIEMVESC